MTWTDVSDETVLTWTELSDETVLEFGDITTTSTVSNQNASRFILSGEREDALGGVDFGLQVSETNFFVITSLDPREISSTTLNDPV